MKHDIITLSGVEYLNTVNNEEDPGATTLEIKCYRFGNTYFAYARTHLGVFKSEVLVDDAPKQKELEKFFDKHVGEIEEAYKQRKDKSFGINMLSFGR